jgi:hypothetical protein
MIQNDKGSPLQRYVRDRDEDAFCEIVSNYIGLVETTALRRVNNDAARSRDITQIVFTDLARQAYASDANPSAQLYAYQAIREIDTTRGLSPDRLVDLMANGNDISRLHAAKLLWNDYKNPEQVVPALKRLITEPADTGSSWSSSIETRDALDLLTEIGPRAQETLPQIRSILENPLGSSLNWIAATNAWRSIAGDQPIPSKRPLP